MKRTADTVETCMVIAAECRLKVENGLVSVDVENCCVLQADRARMVLNSFLGYVLALSNSTLECSVAYCC